MIKKILIIFSGEIERHNNGYNNCLLNYSNWQKSIFGDLEDNSISYDIAFITYKNHATSILDESIKLMKPKYIELHERVNYQSELMQIVSIFLQNLNTIEIVYDRYLFFRFDMVFKIKITKWPCWNKTGIILDYKEKHWYIDKVYGGLIYIFDKDYLKYYHDSLLAPKYNRTPHHIGQYLFENNIFFHCMYNRCYYHTHNPLVVIRPIENEPDLDNPQDGIPIPYIGKTEDYILESLINKSPVIFVKFGDGEYQASLGYRGHNCDGIWYTPTLMNGINESYKYLSKLPNCIIGLWHTEDVTKYWESISMPNWSKYHVFHLENEDILDVKSSIENMQSITNQKHQLFKSIKLHPYKKILVSNNLLSKACLLLNVTKHIIVDPHNWFEYSYTKVYTDIYNELILSNFKENIIILFACGIGSKILISELHKSFPYFSYLDIGSSIDFICTKKDSRGRHISYEDMAIFFDDLIDNKELWNDVKYENLYNEAKKELGIHL